MKYNNISAVLLAFLFVGILFTSCKEEDLSYKLGDAFHFSKKTDKVVEGSPTPIGIPVIYTKTSPVAGSVTVSVTGPEGAFTVVGATTLEFAADQYSDTIWIQPTPNDVQEEDKKVILALTQGTASLGFPGLTSGTTSMDSLVLIIEDDDCPPMQSLAGNYTEATNGKTGGSSSQDINPFPWNAAITITAESATRYVINDITMGLYPGGYNATGGPYNGKNPATFDFIDPTRAIVIDQAASPDVVYGNDSFLGTGKANDNCDGVLTTIDLSWTNTYGDQGVSVLTPQ